MALTPMMQQYFEIKEQCKDCILFFRLGDFYEMFFEDAETASRELELVLTGRDCGLENRAPMCGIPFHASESYIPRLIEKGYKVAICEQVEDPALAKGLVKRDIIRIVTPGTLIESNMLDEKKNNYIGSLYIEGESFSIAVCDISTGEFLTTMGNGSLSKAIDEISKYTPSELILIQNKNIDIDGTLKTIKNKFDVLVNIVDFNVDECNSILKEFIQCIDDIHPMDIIASGCLYKYICQTQKNSLSHITDLKKYNIKDYMVLDLSTRNNLELTETIRSKNRKGSLLWILDKTCTAMGGRMLRKWIEEPLIRSSEIIKRLEVVDELIDDVYTSSDLKEFLKNVYDIERLISRISCSSATPKDIVNLKESIRFLPDIKSVISNCKSTLLKEIYNDFDTLDDVFSLIDISILDNPSIQSKDGGIVKDGYNSEVDKLREAMNNGKKWIADLELKEKDATGIKSLKVGFNKVFGYYIEVTKSNLSNVPTDRFIRKQTLANAERFITPELKEMEELILGAEQKIVDLEYNLFCKIRTSVASHVTRVQKVAKYISTMDVLLSFANVSFENNYVMPSITDKGVIDIKNGRHPVVERVLQSIFVPNDTYLDLKDDSVSIITGPNMAGKSTFMRQVALITLMAQIGCFVPADSASISVVDRIFTRIGASDDLSSGQSTFMVEMSEVSAILENATRNSLVILDEVGRGTSTFDGLSIAWAVVDFIVNNIGAKTLFATHYHELTELEDKMKGVKNYCISVKEHGEDILFLRKIIRGGADHSYGIQVARLAGLPDEVVKKSKEILGLLEQSDINKSLQVKEQSDEVAITENKPKNNQISLFDYQSQDLVQYIKDIDVFNMSPMEAMNCIFDICNRAKKI